MRFLRVGLGFWPIGARWKCDGIEVHTHMISGLANCRSREAASNGARSVIWSPHAGVSDGSKTLRGRPVNGPEYHENSPQAQRNREPRLDDSLGRGRELQGHPISLLLSWLPHSLREVTQPMWHDRSAGLHLCRLAQPIGLGEDLAASPDGSVEVGIVTAFFPSPLLSYTRAFAPDLTLRTPSGRAWPAAGSESWVKKGSLSLRRVDDESQCRAMDLGQPGLQHLVRATRPGRSVQTERKGGIARRSAASGTSRDSQRPIGSLKRREQALLRPVERRRRRVVGRSFGNTPKA
jgi:hypothetical protein